MMIGQLSRLLDARILCNGEDIPLTGFYIGDLLSRVISRATPGGLWITIMNHINVPAVALLGDIPCVLLAEGVEPMEGVVEKCRGEGIWLLQSPKSAFALACEISALLEGRSIQ